ncbi:hypothetical protein Tco_0303573 [Tanacetum coccineum]
MSSPRAPSTGPSTPLSYSAGPSTPLSYSSGPSTPPNYSPGSSRNAECSNCKHLRGKISVLKATLDMHMHPEQHISYWLHYFMKFSMKWKNLIWSSLSCAILLIGVGLLRRDGYEVNYRLDEVGQLNALIAGLEASEDVGELWDTIMCLRDEQRKAEAKLAYLQYWLTMAEEEIVEKQKQLKFRRRMR